MVDSNKYKSLACYYAVKLWTENTPEVPNRNNMTKRHSLLKLGDFISNVEKAKRRTKINIFLPSFVE
jgi:hypothetical protein